MKTTPDLNLKNYRVARSRLVALMALGLGAATLSAQSSSTDSSSSSTPTSSPSNSSTGTYPSAGSAGSGTSGSASTSGAYSGATSGTKANDSSMAGGSMGSDTQNGDQLKRADRKFLNKVAESSMKEVALSQLAQERAQDPQVKSFAQQMVSDHTQLNSELMQLAARKGVELDTSGSHMAWLNGKRKSTASGAGENTAGRTTGTAGSGMSGTDMAASTNSGTTNASEGGSSGLSTGMANSDITNDRHYRSLAKKSGNEFDKEYVDMMVDDHESDVKLFEKAAKDAKDPEVRAFASTNLPKLQSHLQHVQNLNKSVAE